MLRCIWDPLGPDSDLQVGPYDLTTDCLPDTPSVLLRTALADLECSLLNPRYKFLFSTFHVPYQPHNLCGICVAGGIIAQSENMAPDKYFRGQIDGLHSVTRAKLGAISNFSSGNIALGLARIATGAQTRIPNKEYEFYLFDWPHRYHNTDDLSILIPQIEFLADDLEAAGL